MSAGSVPSVIGKYIPVGRLGSGGMADVFLVVARGPERVERLAVLKRLRHPEQQDRIDMFLDEARLAVRLSHPNIVHTYEVGESYGEHFMTMEYLEGQALSDVLAALEDRAEGLTEECIASIAVQALKGLHYAHEFCDFDGTPLGIVHRDVSPHNVFVTYTGEVKILDFGIAKAHLNSTRTETGVLKGKLRYMSPEQAGQADVDRRADVFSFGVIVWEMLARRGLFRGDAISLLNQIAAHKIPKLRDLRPEITPDLDEVVQKSLAREREDRYGTADLMRRDIHRLYRGAGDDDSRAELAKVMNTLFASQRDALRSMIRVHLTKPPTVDGSSSQPNLEASNLPTLVQATPERGTTASLPQISTAGQKIASRSRGGWLIAAAFAFVAVVVGGGFWRARAIGASGKAEPAPAPVQVRSASDTAASIAPAKKAHLRLETNPPGAYVEWEGQRFGPTPTDIPLAAGIQKLGITSPGYENALLTVEAKPGEELTRSVTMQAAVASVAEHASAPTAPAPHPSRHDYAGPRPNRPPVAAPPPPAATAAPSASAEPELKVQMLDEGESK